MTTTGRWHWQRRRASFPTHTSSTPAATATPAWVRGTLRCVGWLGCAGCWARLRARPEAQAARLHAGAADVGAVILLRRHRLVLILRAQGSGRRRGTTSWQVPRASSGPPGSATAAAPRRASTARCSRPATRVGGRGGSAAAGADVEVEAHACTLPLRLAYAMLPGTPVLASAIAAASNRRIALAALLPQTPRPGPPAPNHLTHNPQPTTHCPACSPDAGSTGRRGGGYEGDGGGCQVRAL